MRISRLVFALFALTALTALPLSTSARNVGRGAQAQLDQLTSLGYSTSAERADNGLHLGQLKQQLRGQEDPPAPVQMMVVGVIASVDAQSSTFRLETLSRGTLTVHTDSSTRVTKDGRPASFADIAVKQRARVVGTWDAEHGRLHAYEVRLQTTVVTHMYLTGSVSATNTSSFVLVADSTSSTYTVDAERAIILSRTWTMLALGDVRVGDRLLVWGTVSSDQPNAVRARWIVDMSVPR